MGDRRESFANLKMTGSAQRRIAVPQEHPAVEMAPAETRSHRPSRVRKDPGGHLRREIRLVQRTQNLLVTLKPRCMLPLWAEPREMLS